MNDTNVKIGFILMFCRKIRSVLFSLSVMLSETKIAFMVITFCSYEQRVQRTMICCSAHALITMKWNELNVMNQTSWFFFWKTSWIESQIEGICVLSYEYILKFLVQIWFCTVHCTLMSLCSIKVTYSNGTRSLIRLKTPKDITSGFCWLC